jgi:hypothetical protein
MSRERRHTRAPTALFLALAALLVPAATRADAEADDCAEARCWNFNFLSSGRYTMLALQPTLTFVTLPEETTLDAAVLARYRAEVYRTQDHLSSRVLLAGAIGGGTAGTEGTLDVAFELGAHLPVSKLSGPVLRVAPAATVLGNDALQLSMVEPLRATAGFQWMFGDSLLELGVSSGFLSEGVFGAGGERESLNGAFELGHYIAAHAGWFRLDARANYVQPGPFHENTRVAALRLEACGYVRSGAACFSAQYQQGRLRDDRGGGRTARGLHAGITIGLTP